MRSVIWLVLIFVAAVVAATAFGSNDGLASFYWNGWRFDMSLNLFLLLLIGTCFVLVTVMQAISVLTGLPQRAHEWRTARRDRTAQAALREALAQYFGGRYSRAVSAAQRALAIQSDTPAMAQDNDFTVLAHLLHAGSAHRLQDRLQRDQEMAKALDLAQRSPAARPVEEGARLLAAEFALDDRDADKALALLAELPPGVARRTHALRLKLQASRLAMQPLEAMKTARLLAKHQGFSKIAAQGLLRSLAFESLSSAHDIDQLTTIWQQFDPAERRDPFITAHAVRCAVQFGAANEARQWLRPFWEQLDELAVDERSVLAAALARCTEGIGPDWLPRLEAAARAYPADGAIAHAVGSALAQRQLWGKARSLLEQAAADSKLAASQRRDALLQLARIARQQDDSARAGEFLEAAAKL
ncbi:heme biosynthesis HemY N-terminal domain-containing protein [Piscinibacter sakaiensis]|uniref:heme biosynthesis HemY N-terminal domain-containing protein n=1 Tax=Piscinibacter sakaiensis TaxID=1547922 RepID=UPI003AAB17D5